METINLNIEKALGKGAKEQLLSAAPKAEDAIKTLHKGNGKGNDFLGWLHLPSSISETELSDIEAAAKQLKDRCEIVVAIGIGGSYLGAKAVLEALSNTFIQMQTKQSAPLVLFAGQNIGEDYLYELQHILQNRQFGLINISKSGTTTEPALAFRLLKKQLEDQVGKNEAKNRIIAITDASKGALRKLADKEGYKTFIIPDNVGGRFSVLTPVGLLPIAVAGYDIRQLVKGAVAMENKCGENVPFTENPAAVYAATRNILYKAGKKIEILVNFNPKLHFFAEWWKQLYGESEGKDHLGIYPASVDFTTDLHFLAGKRVDEVNKMAELGTQIAHVDGGVPNLKIEIPEITEYYLGQLIYFFEKACGISGYILGVNPFDQPGVEAYKKNMFALLGKPGYEAETKAIKAKL